MGLKPQLSPRGRVTKEEELKSLLVAAQTVELHLCWWLPKFSIYETSERKISAPAAGPCLCLTLATLGFVGMYTQGLGQDRAWAASKAPTVGPSARLLQLWDLTSVDLCQWPVENNTWQSPGPTAGIPTVKAGLRAVPTTVYFVSLHNGWKGPQQSTFTGEQLQRRNTQWFLSQWECSNPGYLASQIRNTVKKQVWGPLLQQLESRPHHWQGSDNHTAKGRPCSISRAGSGHHSSNQNP